MNKEYKLGTVGEVCSVGVSSFYRCFVAGAPPLRAMITGFNTDVEYKGVTFHVQTEDKGVDNPVIESLIYKGGEILVSRKLPYAKFLANGYDEKKVVKLMEDQHRQMIHEVRRGAFEKPNPLTDETLQTDQSLDQVILNYLATKKQGGGEP